MRNPYELSYFLLTIQPALPKPNFIVCKEQPFSNYAIFPSLR